MLCLTRNIGEPIIIDGHIKIKILDVKGRQIRLDFNAPNSVHIVREELILSDDETNPIRSTDKDTCKKISAGAV